MVAILSWFTSPLRKGLSIALLVLSIVGTIFLKGRNSGKESVRNANAKELEKNVKVKRKIHQDVANDSNADLDKRLRRWVKK